MEKSLVLISLQRTQKKKRRKRAKKQAETEREKCAQQRPLFSYISLSLSHSLSHTQLLNNRFFFRYVSTHQQFFRRFFGWIFISQLIPPRLNPPSVPGHSQWFRDAFRPPSHTAPTLPNQRCRQFFFVFFFLSFLNVASLCCCCCCYCCLVKDIDYICVLFTATKCCIYYIFHIVILCLCVLGIHRKIYVKEKKVCFFFAPHFRLASFSAAAPNGRQSVRPSVPERDRERERDLTRLSG